MEYNLEWNVGYNCYVAWVFTLELVEQGFELECFYGCTLNGLGCYVRCDQKKKFEKNMRCYNFLLPKNIFSLSKYSFFTDRLNPSYLGGPEGRYIEYWLESDLSCREVGCNRKETQKEPCKEPNRTVEKIV